MRDINIKIVLEENSPKLVCDDDQKIIGAMWDNRGQRLVFARDATLTKYDMMLQFRVGKEWKEIDIGTNNTFEVINAYTQDNTLRFRLAFYEGSTFKYGSINDLVFKYSPGPQTAEIPEEDVNQYMELLAAAKQYSAEAVEEAKKYSTSATTAAEKAQAALAALAATDVGALQDSVKLLNDSLVNNYGGTNLLVGTKDLSGLTSKTYITDETYRNFTIVHADRSSATVSTDAVYWNGSVEVEADAWYTLSFWAKGTGSFTSYFYASNTSTVTSGVNSIGNTTGSADGSITTSVTSEWKRYWISWKTLTSASGTKNLIMARIPTGNDIYMCGIMFERGKYAHDWDYSPKDNELTTLTSFAVSASDVSIQAPIIYKQNKIVICSFRISITATRSIAAYELITTLSTGFRPVAETWFTLNSVNNQLIGRVGTDGTVYIYFLPTTPINEWFVVNFQFGVT